MNDLDGLRARQRVSVSGGKVGNPGPSGVRRYAP